MINSSPPPARRSRAQNVIIVALCAVVVALAGSQPAEAQPGRDHGAYYTRHLEPGNDNPMIATGVTLDSRARTYKSSGLGPAALNPAATAGTPEAYVDATQFPGGRLTGGVTITEAQGMNVLRQIEANLKARGLRLSDVTTMRVFLDNAPGTDRADYAGWNRAYRQFFANTSLKTGKPIPVPMGTADPAPPLVTNPARPSRFALEIASLPVNGWLVEVEVDAVYPRSHR